MSIVLDPEDEFAIIMYIINYDDCNDTIYQRIRDCILDLNIRKKRTVYRGQGNRRIETNSYFFSTTPKQKMAQMFQPFDWDSTPPKRECCMFKIHLENVPILSTRSIRYTLSPEVKKLYKKFNKHTPIKSWKRVSKLLEELVFTNEEQNGQEIIVVNGGRFYTDVNKSHEGFNQIDDDTFETWYIY